MQVERVTEAAPVEVEEHVATVGQPSVVDGALIAHLVGDAQLQGLSVEGVHLTLAPQTDRKGKASS